MTSYREEILGVPEAVQAAVDVDVFACTRGPAALDRALAAIPAVELVARYRAALGRLTMQPTSRRSNRRDWSDFTSAEEAAEHRQITRGGNR